MDLLSSSHAEFFSRQGIEVSPIHTDVDGFGGGFEEQGVFGVRLGFNGVNDGKFIEAVATLGESYSAETLSGMSDWQKHYIALTMLAGYSETVGLHDNIEVSPSYEERSSDGVMRKFVDLRWPSLHLSSVRRSNTNYSCLSRGILPPTIMMHLDGPFQTVVPVQSRFYRGKAGRRKVRRTLPMRILPLKLACDLNGECINAEFADAIDRHSLIKRNPYGDGFLTDKIGEETLSSESCAAYIFFLNRVLSDMDDLCRDDAVIVIEEMKNMAGLLYGAQNLERSPRFTFNKWMARLHRVCNERYPDLVANVVRGQFIANSDRVMHSMATGSSRVFDALEGNGAVYGQVLHRYPIDAGADIFSNYRPLPRFEYR